MVVSRRRHSISDTVAVVVAASGCRRLLVDLLQVLVFGEIRWVVAAVGHYWFHLVAKQSF